MKGFAVFTKSLIFVLLLSASAFAQTERIPAKANKIAVVNSAFFYDEKLGIRKLASAEKLMGMTDCIAFEKYYSTFMEIERLEKEIIALEYQKLSVKDKLKQLEKLKDENNKAKNEDEACRRKIRSENVDPVVKDVRKKLQEFAKQKGFVVVIDAVQDSAFLIIESEYTDITSEFIKFCNDSFEKEKTQ